MKHICSGIAVSLILTLLLAACNPPGSASSGSASSQPTGSAEQVPVGSRWQEAPMEVLTPQPDYGTLVPFQGTLDDRRFGLMTLEGQVVLDPVCREVILRECEELDLSVLELRTEHPELGEPSPHTLVAVAAADGSWVTPFRYWGCSTYPDGLLAGDGDHFYRLDPRSGQELQSWTWAELGIDDPASFPWITGDAYSTAQWADGRFFLGDKDRIARYLDPETGEVTTSPVEEWFSYCDQKYQVDGWWEVAALEDGTVRLTRDCQSHTFPLPIPLPSNPNLRVGRVLAGEFVVFQNGDGQFAVTRLDGSAVLPAQDGKLCDLYDRESGGVWFALFAPNGKGWTLYNREGALRAQIPGAETDSFFLQDPFVVVRNEAFISYYRPEDGTCIFRTYFAPEG